MRGDVERDAVGVVADLTDKLGAESSCATAHDPFGVVQVLVNKAGTTSMSSSDDPTSIADILISQSGVSNDRNVASTPRMIRAAFPDTRQGGFGHVVTGASVSRTIQAYAGDFASRAGSEPRGVVYLRTTPDCRRHEFDE
ncbi:3-oxoacyl-[acyl-carrier protein] reductase [Sulfitobacter delicatus]|jgi:NAD(P)-dependent dehydrogenase (short-subunit alcohol dehydrogenase family)|uniref:3-oxoacyl-[acyl-carrier protein] reductase n=1 Tax=Sulfitobacter delicatus TaxID=218672 RepID=A0A1G7ZR86_9RHOB|nr:3-oxoacyl-[acyl-carrier protein] reductase [Sulfitobacter delicatus]